MRKVTEKAWGNECLVHQGHGYAVKVITLHRGMSTSLHYHEKKHETIVVHSGILMVNSGPNVASLSPQRLSAGESLAIEPLVVHRMTADSEDCIYFEAQTDFLDDVVRLEDEHIGSR